MAQLRVAGEIECVEIDQQDYFEIDGMVLELKRQLRQRGGYPFNLVALKKHLQIAIEGAFEGARPCPVLKQNKTKSGWRLLQHVPKRVFVASDFEPIPVVTPGNFIKGAEIAMRAQALQGDLGQEDAEFLLDNQEELPPAFHEYKQLLFTGTVWRVGDQRLIPVMVRVGIQWSLEFLPLGRVFRSDAALVRKKSS